MVLWHCEYREYSKTWHFRRDNLHDIVWEKEKFAFKWQWNGNEM